MGIDFGLLIGIAAALLVVTAVLAAALAFLFSKLSPFAAKPPEAVEEEAEPVDETVLAARKAAYRLGILVLIGLGVLTALEFWIAAALAGSTALLFVIILAKAGLILQYYMHLSRVWGEEEAHG